MASLDWSSLFHCCGDGAIYYHSGLSGESIAPSNLALLGLVGKMYSKIQFCGRVSGTNHRDTKDTKTDRYYIS
ncbi:hypothetical protein MICAG_1530006 [Microcystis aeruginosa PCC 9808]|uniref:Uncharacterized protein n=1 Tax=Microcystis aeruginosa PCC 9808 TaxID=1160284 RepID=I4HIM9_MICAE|nr:hypothetical protein MICAG_1530006 [Microcystis aeruginosa PCC 9808]